MSTVDAIRAVQPRRETLLYGALLLTTELLLVMLYAAWIHRSGGAILTPLYLVLPWVWVNAALIAVRRVPRPTVEGRPRYLAAVVGVGYFALLAYVGGLVGPGHPGAPSLALNWRLPPGFSPAVLAEGLGVKVLVMPYKAVGYVALAYLVYVTVADAAGSAVSGLLGLFSCVSCAWPVVGTVLAAVFGGGSAVATFALTHSYVIGTAVFLSALALLTWRPSFR